MYLMLSFPFKFSTVIVVVWSSKVPTAPLDAVKVTFLPKTLATRSV